MPLMIYYSLAVLPQGQYHQAWSHPEAVPCFNRLTAIVRTHPASIFCPHPKSSHAFKLRLASSHVDDLHYMLAWVVELTLRLA